MTRSAKNVFDNYPTLYAIHETSDHTCLIDEKCKKFTALYKKTRVGFQPFF